MARIEIYTKDNCPYCDMAKAFFKRKGWDYTEHNLEQRIDELLALKERTGHRTVPQIFINGEFIGGYTDMAALDKAGQLEARVSG